MKSYIDYINNYWYIAQEYRFTPMEGYLYFYLLSVANKYGWRNSFKLSNQQIMANIDVTKATLIKARLTLIKAKLISFKPSNNKREGSSYIIGYKNYTQCDTQCDTLHKTKIKTNIKKRNIKEKKDFANLDLKFDEPKKTKKENTLPTIEEVVKICLSKGMTEDEAKDFFYYYDAQGWVTSSGQQIKRLDSMVNRWLKNGKEKRDENNNSNSEKREKRNREVIEDVMSRYL